MSKILSIMERGTGREVFIGKNAQIGRYNKVEWATERTKPVEFDGLELVVQIDGPSSEEISRNHCGIYSEGNNEFSIIDLNSLNGTQLNGQKLEGGKKYPLKPGSAITLSNRLTFDVLGYIDPDNNNYSLLIGHDGGNLKGVKNDLDVIEEELSRRGFAGNIKRLHNGTATRTNILSYLQELVPLTTMDSHFVFQYSGHGSKDGLYLPNRALLGGLFGAAECIGPEELYSHLRNLRGKKALFLDCCNAGVFLEGVSVPEHTLVIAATKKTNLAYEKRTKKIGGGHMGVLTSAVAGYLKENSGRLNLANLRQYLSRSLPGGEYGIHFQEPVVGGTSCFTLKTSIGYDK